MKLIHTRINEMECKENTIRIITKFNFRLDVCTYQNIVMKEIVIIITTIYRARSPRGGVTYCVLGLPGSRSWRKTTTLIKQLTKL